MSKNSGKSLLDFKTRSMDPISNSFCAAKWLNATIWLGSGKTASCHHPSMHQIDSHEIEQNPSALHNTSHKKEMRAQMLRGEKPSECDYCWRMEETGTEIISDRILKTVIYPDALIKKIGSMNPSKDVELKTLEVAFDRNCNFACSYCSAGFSTRWSQDIKKNGIYKNLVSDGAAVFQQDGSWAEDLDQYNENKYTKAFWKWWPDLAKSLDEIRVTGGEPLLSKSFWKLLELLIANKSTKPVLALNSNLGVSSALIDKLINKTNELEIFDIYTSCEAYGNQAEYLRDGMVFEEFVSNIEKLLIKTKVRKICVMMTLSSLSLYSITDFIDLLLDLKIKYGYSRLSFSLNILRFPSFMSPSSLPAELIEERVASFIEAKDRFDSHPMFQDKEKEIIKRLIAYLQNVRIPHRRTSSVESRYRDFKSFYSQYDIRRNKSFTRVFPKQLVDWYRKIPETDISSMSSAEIERCKQTEGWSLSPEAINP